MSDVPSIRARGLLDRHPRLQRTGGEVLQHGIGEAAHVGNPDRTIVRRSGGRLQRARRWPHHRHDRSGAGYLQEIASSHQLVSFQLSAISYQLQPNRVFDHQFQIRSVSASSMIDLTADS